MELAPGWSFLNTGWSPICFWVIGVLVGAISGGLLCEKALIPGVFGGATAAMSGLFCLQIFLNSVEVVHSVIAGVIIIVGSFLGVCAGYWLNVALNEEDNEEDNAAQAPTA